MEFSFPLGIPEIKQLIPHRHPFLLLDRVTEFSLNERIVGEKSVSFNEPCFPGHFPDFPVMPGVLILEAMGQLGGVFVRLCRAEQMDGNDILMFSGMDKVRFRRQVLPGDQLRIEMHQGRQKLNTWRMEAAAFVGEEKVAEANLMASIVNPSA